jgi:hypothetical protein
MFFMATPRSLVTLELNKVRALLDAATTKNDSILSDSLYMLSTKIKVMYCFFLFQ